MAGQSWLELVKCLHGYAEDTYEWFTRLGFQLLRPGGGIGFITADTFFTLGSFVTIRELSAVTLFDKLLRKTFSVSLGSRIPTRILPVSSRPPRDLITLFDGELTEVDRLLELGKRRGAKAAAKLDLSRPRTHALIYELGIQEDNACYRELKRKGQTFKGYSLKALERLREARKTLNLDEVWKRQRQRFGVGARKKKPH